MAQSLTFTSWERSKLFDPDPAHPFTKVNGRQQGSIPITVTDTTTMLSATDKAPVTLMAAGDIAGLKPGAVKHMAPAPFTADAETTKLVHIDLWDTGLPWRYTPSMTVTGTLPRPWLVLLVGTAQEIQVEGGIANVSDAVLAEHNLQHSRFWAHIQQDGNEKNSLSRIISPRGLSPNSNGELGLLPQHTYVAVLVPAFNKDGEDMWTVAAGRVERKFGSKGVLPAFHSWRFMTAEGGDFETLAAALRLPPTANVGRAQLHYRRNIAADGLHVNEKLEIGGAITSLQVPLDQQVAIDKVRADLDILNNSLPNAIGLPHYGQPWLPDPDAVASGWPADLNDDPRFRGISGLGAWMGVEAQEALMEAAVKQTGALREAGQRIGNLALGLLASGSLWGHRMPTDKHERLRILGPMMGRMLAGGGGLVLTLITSGTSPLPPALFSAAAQRVLRDRSSQTRHLSDGTGGISRSRAMAEANQPEALPERVAGGIPHLDEVAQDMGLETLEEFLRVDNALLTHFMKEVRECVQVVSRDWRFRREDLLRSGREHEVPRHRQEMAETLFHTLADLLQRLLSSHQLPCEGRQILDRMSQETPGELLVFFSMVLDDRSSQLRLYDRLWQALVRCMAITPCRERLRRSQIRNREAFCEELIASLVPEPVAEKVPIDLGLLSDRVSAALDPRQAEAPAKVRLCSRLKGIDCSRLTRPEFPLGLDFPTWSLLKQYDKEWLLPGVSGLEKNSVLALQTNSAFIDAFMVGINTQFMSEMRWRDLAVDRTCTPLRMFWGQVNYATQKRQADIEPLAQWAIVPTDPIGALSHQTIQPDDPSNDSGNRLVLVFRSDLFRRYPSTLVYLVKPSPGSSETQIDELLKQVPALDMPSSAHPVDSAGWKAEMKTWRENRKFFGPTFVGTITPEITFFSFDVKPGELEKYWLVLDEPPAELRFRNDKPFNTSPTNADSVDFALTMLDKPTRVAISGADLKKAGIS